MSEIKSYTVVWKIEVTATSPEFAALQAIECMPGDRYSTATVFEVTDDETKEMSVVDTDKL